MDLVDFLKQRLDEDERDAREIQGLVDNFAEEVRYYSPARVLAEVAAKRAIVVEHPQYDDIEPCCRTCGSDDGAGSLIGEWPCTTLGLLAQPYADHPDYREEWRP